MNIPLFLTSHVSKGDNWHVSWFCQNLIACFFMDTVWGKSSKLWMILTLLGAYRFILGLMTLALFQGNRCVRIINCKLFFSFLMTVIFKNIVWVLHALKSSSAVCFLWLVCIKATLLGHLFQCCTWMWGIQAFTHLV